MELKPGYKQTEVGIIPEPWDVLPFATLITNFRGGAALEPSDFTSAGVKVLPKGGVGRTGWLRVEDSEAQYCSPGYAATHQKNQVDETFTVVVLRDLVPSGPSIGLMVQIRAPEVFVLAQGVYGFKPSPRALPGYLVQLSNTAWYRRLANSIMVGSTQVHITNTAFKRFLIPLPPPPEQEVISEALGNADALIESLEQLITKKRQIKQGAMQELLTGKKRLPGFEVKPGYKRSEMGMIPNDWELKPLLTAVRVAQGQVDPKSEPYKSMFLVGPIHVESGTGKLVTRETAAEQRAISGKYIFS
jgi:type I restriction enzyme, S subunit